ncbi:uroporphyrinogen-III synthase [Microbacterium sp. H1-D42]|uniref:uroporphyrinogen-III synthase n=1 Tax=Microbacterium sp. H1-D42 TaxID=2925844 RepID=UPI001F539EA7|nr:uroporphyrinogen-III synthase [Microbacterium sp. H1-D42]UNK72445.1 uroporphyrinogen-III synthase [Microbacterium sp. H1-D42]
MTAVSSGATPNRLDAALVGCTIVIAADRRGADLAAALERHGAQTYRAPALSIIPNADDEQLLACTEELLANPPDIVIVTTAVGFRGWMDAVHEQELSDALSAAFARTRFVARGPKAHGAILQAGFRADWVAVSETAAEVGEHLTAGDIRGLRIAVQHHGAGADGLDTLLAERGADVVNVTVYRWGPPPDLRVVHRSVLQAGAGEVDAVLFTSAPGAAAWVQTASDAGALEHLGERAASGRLLLAAVGPVTAGPLEAARLRTTVATRGRLGSLVRCVVDHFGSEGSPRQITPAGHVQVRSGGALVDGAYVPLSRASAGVLGALFDAEGRVLTRQELGRALPRGGDSLHAVEMAIARLRDALGEGQIIRTVIKRGYRLEVADAF